MEKIALITGASRGIGAATARLAAKHGWAVAVNYAGNSLAADEVVRAIRARGGHAIAVQADVSDEAQVLRLFATVVLPLGAGVAAWNAWQVLRGRRRLLAKLWAVLLALACLFLLWLGFANHIIGFGANY